MPEIETKSSVPTWCVTPREFPGRMRGNKGSEEFDGNELAKEAWGEACEYEDSGLTAFAYLWRRFGPPDHGSDDHKELCGYYIGTPNPEIFLTISPSGMPLEYAVGYISTEAFQDKLREPRQAWFVKLDEWAQTHSSEKTGRLRYCNLPEADYKRAVAEIGHCPHADSSKWREDTGAVHELNQALFDCMVELMRPVYIRDVQINIFGRIDGIAAANFDDPAPRSKYAGLGISLEALDELLKDD